MKLYYAPGACSLSPHIVAREAGIPLELEKVDLGAKKTASGEDYRQVNPKGYVPALRLDYRLQEWLAFLNSEIHKTWGALFDPRAERGPVIEKLNQRLQFVNGQLEKRPYLLAGGFSVADAYLFTLLNWAGFTRVDLAPYPALVKYAERIGARPKVQEALEAEGLLKKAA